MTWLFVNKILNSVGVFCVTFQSRLIMKTLMNRRRLLTSGPTMSSAGFSTSIFSIYHLNRKSSKTGPLQYVSHRCIRISLIFRIGRWFTFIQDHSWEFKACKVDVLSAVKKCFVVDILPQNFWSFNAKNDWLYAKPLLGNGRGMLVTYAEAFTQ